MVIELMGAFAPFSYLVFNNRVVASKLVLKEIKLFSLFPGIENVQPSSNYWIRICFSNFRNTLFSLLYISTDTYEKVHAPGSVFMSVTLH